MSDSMNSDERQRLNTNELGQTVQAVGHRLEQYATQIVVGVCAVLVVGAAWIWWSRQANSGAAKAWTQLESAQNVNDYGEVADNYKGTLAGRWARLRESESYLQTGLAQLMTDRENALSDLKKAREGFEQVTSNNRPASTSIQERGLWGLALTLEATSDQDTSKASEVYQRLLNEVPETYYKALAEQRIAALKTGGAKEFYAWFSKQNPKPSEARPKDGMSGDEFDMMLPRPGKSEFNLHPELPKGGAKSEPKSEKADPGTAAPSPKADTPVTPEGTVEPKQPEPKQPEPKQPEPKSDEPAAKPEEKVPAAEPKADKEEAKKDADKKE
jgi:hypothetical protein